MNLNNGEIFLFVGDSITDCGRGDMSDTDQKLGDGYVYYFSKMMSENYPQHQLRILNSGISGHRIVDLKDRWEKDVIAWKPDWLFIFIGINDVWRHFDAMGMVQQVTRKQYEKIYRELIQLSKDMLKLRVLGLVSPYYLELDNNNPMRKMMNEYNEIVRQLSQEYDAIYVDLQIMFDHFIQIHGWPCISEDQIHVNRRGHELIAHEIFEKI